jgi:hypothetical protein
MRVFGLDDAPAAATAIADMAVVANCAGPFAATSARNEGRGRGDADNSVHGPLRIGGRV